MEQLRFIPVFMFLSGILLVYGGFTNQTPVEIIRRNLGPIAGGPYKPYPEYENPNGPMGYSAQAPNSYVGVSYSRPSMSPGPRLYQ